MDFYDMVKESADYISGKIDTHLTLGIILGSGLGDLVDMVEDKEIVPYSDIPHFPKSTVAGHAGNFVFGHVGKVNLVLMQGRFHYYEGFTMKELTFPTYVMKLLGVEKLIVTNACGGINKSFAPGDLMLITDFINMLGNNSLIGPNDERFGPRFPDMSEPFPLAFRSKAEAVANELGIGYKEGVYALFSGPCYETAAEIRAFASLGADAIGMSTVPETIAANYLGMEVLGIACITNMATGIAKEKHSHEEVLRIANEASDRLCKWVAGIIRSLV